MSSATIIPPSSVPAPHTGDRTVILDRGLLVRVMNFQFRPLVDRMIDKLGWSEEEAVFGFEDMKRFLFLCGAFRTSRLAPAERIDEVWHNFILFTEDYQKFCHDHFGRFIHHRPRRKDDPKPRGDMAFETLRHATLVFGTLSRNWMFIRKDGSVLNAEAGLDCVPSCSHGSPSTNCQSGENHTVVPEPAAHANCRRDVGECCGEGNCQSG